MSPLALLGGWALTLYPEFSENREIGAPPAEFLADAAIDSVGFVGSEVAGDFAAGFTSGTGPGAIGAKLVADIGAGFAYDLFVDGIGARQWLTNELEQMGHSAQVTVEEAAPLVTAQPNPTAPSGPILGPTGTPAPGNAARLEAASDDSRSGEDNVCRAPATSSITPIVTQTPSP